MADDILSVSGMKTAVADAVDTSVLPPDHMDGQQLALLPLRNAHDLVPSGEEESSAGRGAGRPKGAKNKSTKEWTDFMLSRYRSPLQFLAEVYSRPLPELAKELLEYAGAVKGARPTYAQVVELLKIQLGAAKELAPYLHQKQPLAIQGDDKGFINLFIGTEYKGEMKASEATNFDLQILDIGNEENQGFSESENHEFNEKDFNASPESVAESGNCDNKPTD